MIFSRTDGMPDNGSRLARRCGGSRLISTNNQIIKL